MLAVFLLAWLVQEGEEELPLLRVGEAVAGEITDVDPPVHTTMLDAVDTDTPVVGKAFLVEVEESGLSGEWR